MDKTLVKVKIVKENNGSGLVLYFWKKTFWIFGYWYALGAKSSFGKIDDDVFNVINDNNVSRVLFKNFIKK